MKFTLAIAAVLALASPLNAYKVPSTGNGELAEIVQKVIDLIPLKDVAEITKTYVAQDKEFESMLKIVTSQDSKSFISQIEAHPLAKKLFVYIQQNGLDIYYLINKLNSALKLPAIKPQEITYRNISGGIQGYFKDILEVLPMQEIVKVITDSTNKSQAVKGLIELLSGSEYKDFQEEFRHNQSYLSMVKQAKEELGFDQWYFDLGYVARIIILTAFGK